MTADSVDRRPQLMGHVRHKFIADFERLLHLLFHTDKLTLCLFQFGNIDGKQKVLPIACLDGHTHRETSPVLTVHHALCHFPRSFQGKSPFFLMEFRRKQFVQPQLLQLLPIPKLFPSQGVRIKNPAIPVKPENNLQGCVCKTVDVFS